MIFEAGTAQGKKTEVFDAMGHLIGSCFKYNSKTRVVEMFLTVVKSKKGPARTMMMKEVGKGSWQAVKIKVKVPGSYAIMDGKRY